MKKILVLIILSISVFLTGCGKESIVVTPVAEKERIIDLKIKGDEIATKQYTEIVEKLQKQASSGVEGAMTEYKDWEKLNTEKLEKENFRKSLGDKAKFKKLN